MLYLLKRKLAAMKKINMLFLTFITFLISFISLGYSALDQNLMITGDVNYYFYSKKLYDVFLLETRKGTLTEEYLGNHQDGVVGNGTNDIFYWYAEDNDEASTILNKNNVIFAGQCWQMIRTTDTGGVKMIYNGEAENNQCLNTRGTHVGYKHFETQNLASSYYYGDSYTYDSSTGLFSLDGHTEAVTWNAVTGPAMVGRYTCKEASASATCSTLYLVESYLDSTTGRLMLIDDESPYSQFGIGKYSVDFHSMADAGYMYNSSTSISRINEAATSGSLFGTGVTYANGVYTLTNTSTTFDTTHHYTCNNTTGTCSTVRYYYRNNNHYLEISDGRTIEQVVNDMLYASNVNQDNSIIKTSVDAWYARYLTGYDRYIEDTIYCNDRSIIDLGGFDPNGGAVDSFVQFKEYVLTTDLSCSRATDQFSTLNSSAQLKYKAGLMSSAEMNLLNNDIVRATGEWYWLLSPYQYSSGGSSNFYKVVDTGEIKQVGAGGYNEWSALGIRPAISLVYGTEYVSGTGSMADPYIVDAVEEDKQYVLTYDSNGGSTCSSKYVVKDDGNAWGTLCTPTRTGYSFAGWNTRKDGTGSMITSTDLAEYNITAFAQWTDNIAPIITGTTVSTSYDMTNYVDFTAEDIGSGIVGYNITKTDSEPTNWIPIVNTVPDNMETKYDYGVSWGRVFHHNNHWGEYYFTDSTDALSSSTADQYSKLGTLENYKFSNKWEFLLEYPEVSLTLYNHWTQTVNPATTTVADTGSTTVSGYTPVHVDWTNAGWGGLALSTNASTFIDGQVGVSQWNFPIGVYSYYKGGMPGPGGQVSTVNLWSRIDTLPTTSSNTISRRIGGIQENETYYVWVMDSAGNTTNEEVTISKVDTTHPTIDFSVTDNVASSQTATITLGDDKAIAKYYFGTTNPLSNTVVTYTPVSGTVTSKTITETINNGGTYYVAVVDKAGNRTITSKVFYQTTLTPNQGSVSPASVITESGDSFTIPIPGAITGYSFDGWFTNSNLTTSAGTVYTPTGNNTLYGKWTNTDGPSVAFTSTASFKATSQTLTLKCVDSNSGLAGYYYGTSNPASTTVTYTTTSADLTSLAGSGLTRSVTSAGTYYLSCKGSNGKVSTKNIVIRSYTVRNMLNNVTGSTYTTTDYTQASSATYVIPNGTTMTLTKIYTVPSGSNANKFVGYSTGAPSTTDATPSTTNPTISANSVYTMWFTRNIIRFHIKPNSGIVQATTHNAGNTVTYTWSIGSDGYIYRDGSNNSFASYRYGVTSIDLPDYHNKNYLYIDRVGYTVSSSSQAYICESGCTTSGQIFSQASMSFTSSNNICNAASNDCDVVIKVNWTRRSYTLTYALNSGTVATANPTSYNVDSSAITLNNPTKNGYHLNYWTDKVTNLVWFSGMINLNSGIIETDSDNPDAYYTDMIRLKANVAYTIGGYGDYAGIRWRVYNTSKVYTGNGSNTNKYTPTTDCYVRILFYNTSTADQRSGTYITSNATATATIPKGSTHNRTFTASYAANTYTIAYTMRGGTKASNTPSSGTYGSDVVIPKPTKRVTVTGNVNGSGATVGNATYKDQTFAGWSSTTVGSNAKTGTAASPTTAWDGTLTTNTYFKNLKEEGSVTMVANWTSVAVTLPSLSRSGYECRWYTAASGGSVMGAGGASWKPSATGSATVTAYARCIKTITWNYSYSGNYKTFTAPLSGKYKIELWGAQGMGGGKGAYVYGTISLTEGQVLYVYVGGQAGWNGGGSSPNGNYGGDATDVRLTVGRLLSRIMVAGGGGSAGVGRTTQCEYPSQTCGYGTPGAGGLASGADATNGYQKHIFWKDNGEVDYAVTTTAHGGAGGTQTAGGAKGSGSVVASYSTATATIGGTKGTWGTGGDGATLTNSTSGFNNAISGAGGGGWYGGGGGGAAGWANSGHQMRAASGGGGGSSFIHGASGYTRRDNLDYAATEFKFSSAGGSAGNRSGNGYATISFVS